MNEHDLENRLRAAQRAEGQEADPGALLERVLSIPETVEPERRRWWHGLPIGSLRGAGGGGATTKGGPTMFSAMRAAAIVSVLALTGMLAISGMFGPDPEPLAPAAGTPAVSEWVTVTGTETHDCGAGSCSVKSVMNDPRVSSQGFVTWKGDWESLSSDTNYALWGEYSASNDGGAWGGEWVGFVDADGNHHITWWARGSGEYEGLVYLATAEQRDGGEMDVTGLVYPGEMPPTVVLGTGDEPAS